MVTCHPVSLVCPVSGQHCLVRVLVYGSSDLRHAAGERGHLITEQNQAGHPLNDVL